MKAIIAKNNLDYIGLNNGLPWKHNRNDLNHFKSLTDGCIVLVGYNTFKTLPELKNRAIVLDDRNKIINIENIDWCIGGKKTYEKYCHLFTELHISNINDDTIGDTKFPDLANLNPNCRVFNYWF